MHTLTLPDIAERYFRRFGFREEMLAHAPPAGIKLIIVIPCYDEPELLLTLNSLRDCSPPRFPVEVLLVINAGAHEVEVKKRNRQSLRVATDWARQQHNDWLHLHCLWVDDLPPKHAGVGLARKIGMDEALRRFARLDYNGMIVCLDADCTVAPNYLQTLEQLQTEQSPGSCTLHFEHRAEQMEDPSLKQGIIYYELFLRYYANALAYSGFPYSMHTIGSSMAVRADIYALSGGMNRRKAGEDFYFLHKVVPLGTFRKVDATAVFPSGRLSERVPFGTGKAQQEWLDNPEKRGLAYHFDIFRDLKSFLSVVPALYKAEDGEYLRIMGAQPETVQDFMSKQNLQERINEIKANSASFKSFRKRFFAWFDGFKVLKFVHYCRDRYYKSVELPVTCNWLLEQHGFTATQEPSELLSLYRRLDKERSLKI